MAHGLIKGFIQLGIRRFYHYLAINMYALPRGRGALRQESWYYRIAV